MTYTTFHVSLYGEVLQGTASTSHCHEGWLLLHVLYCGVLASSAQSAAHCSLAEYKRNWTSLVEALSYKQEGRGFETRWVTEFFSIYLNLPAAIGLGVSSASNRSIRSRKKFSYGADHGRCARLTNLLRLSRHWGSLASHNLIGLRGLLRAYSRGPELTSRPVSSTLNQVFHCSFADCFCGLVVRVPVYRSRGSGFDSRRYQIFWVVGLERDPLSLVSTIEELLKRKSSGFSLKTENTAIGIRHTDHVVPFIRKNWH
jgi:hypothetical protein